MHIDAGTAHVPSEHLGDETPLFTRSAVRAFRIAMPLAILAILIAVALNWWFVPSGGEALPGPDMSVTGGEIPGPGQVALEKPALDMLPNRILQWETITRQAIPGYGDAGAEVIYRTLSMNMAAQISTVTYARAEGFSSEMEAAARLQELMQPYTEQRTNEMVGQTSAIVGLTSDHGAYAKGWTNGRYVTYVKTSYDEWIAEAHPEILKKELDRIAKDVEFYQRTGQEGVQAR